MIHVGVDLHRRFCYMTALDAMGRCSQSGAVANELKTLQDWLRSLPAPREAAVEACSFWPAFQSAIEAEVSAIHLVHPQGVKAIAAAKRCLLRGSCRLRCELTNTFVFSSTDCKTILLLNC